MQVSPLLTPLNFNTRKRARSIEDYEAHYFKKRLISCLSSIMQDISSSNNSNNNMNMGDVFIDEDDDVKKEEKEEFEVNNTASSRIKNININGSILPMEQRSGESKCRIPLFVLNDNLYNNNDLPLVLYQKNDWSSITELEEDDSSITSNDPMDLD